MLSRFGSYKVGVAFAMIVCLCNTMLAQEDLVLKRYLKVSDSIYYSHPDSSFSLAVLSQSLAIKTADSSSLAKSLVNQGRYLLLKSDLQAANSKLLKASVVFKNLNDKKGLAYVYKIRSILSERIGNQADVTSYLVQSINLYKEANDTNGAVLSLLNLSLEYTRLNKLDSAEITLAEIDQLCGNLSNSKKYFLYQNKGIVSLRKKEYDKANDLFLSALKIAVDENMIDSKATIYKFLCETNRLNGNATKANEYVNLSVAISKENDLDNELIEAYDELIELKRTSGDFESAFNIIKEQNLLKAKIINTDKLNQIAFLEKKMALAEKQAEIESQKATNIQSRARNKILIYVISCIILILMAVVYLLVRTRIFHKKISVQNKLLSHKNSIIEEKQKEILDSIQYAKRIQDTLLAHKDLLNANLPDNFIFFHPKDIVSGDFYWATKHNSKFYLAVCDSTGHGVPGAFMSLLNIGFLSEAIKEKSIVEPHKIFDYVRTRLINSVSKEGQKDGFDGILLCIDQETNVITYAAAHSSPILISRNGLLELPKDKMPVGDGERQEAFSLFTIKANKDDVLYLYTDGYPDQFGGPKGKKYKSKQLNELLQLNSALPFAEQKELLFKTFTSWQGHLDQVDDVCVVGIRL